MLAKFTRAMRKATALRFVGVTTPRLTAQGAATLVDARQRSAYRTALGITAGAVALAVGGQLLAWVSVPELGAARFAGLSILPIAFVLAGYQRWLDGAFEPAELSVPAWPMRPGETVEVRFRRRARSAIAFEAPRASWVCQRVTSHSAYGTDDMRMPELVMELSLPPTHVHLEPGMVEATWEVPVQVGLDSLAMTQPSRRREGKDDYVRRLEWQLIVVQPFSGGCEVDSVFGLEVASPLAGDDDA